MRSDTTSPACDEPRAQSWDQVGHAGQWRPRHPTKGAPQVQAEADPSVQEQAAKEGSAGVSWDSLGAHFSLRLRLYIVIACGPYCLWSHWQIWWWHSWNGGLRHRWVGLRFPRVIPVWLVQQSECLLCLVVDITVICPWEAFNHLELHELAQYGIIWASPAPLSGLALTTGRVRTICLRCRFPTLP